MKRTIAWMITLLLLLGALAGCGPTPAAEPAAAQPTEAPAAETEAARPAETEAAAAPTGEGAATEVCDVDGSVLFEKDGLKITTAGLDLDPTEENPHAIVWLEIENSADRDACLGVANGSVDGWMSEVRLIGFYEEDGMVFGADYEMSFVIPARSSVRYALGYSPVAVPGVSPECFGELEFRFTLAEDEYAWPDYTSAPVTIATGETVEPTDLAALGTVVLENDSLMLVIGEQGYDDWSGPQVTVYAANKTERFLGLTAETAEADGIFCDSVHYDCVMAPGKCTACPMSFEGELRELKGFEELSIVFALRQGDTADELNAAEGEALEPVSVSYPPQVWGLYENGGLRLEIQPKYNDLISVETPAEDENGILFTVAETASQEAGGYEGAGWLFSVAKVSEARLHEMLGADMSGRDVFARDYEGNYYVYYHPTDVRYERATAEEMTRDAAQWTMLNEWAAGVPEQLIGTNGLENVSFGNTEVEISLARAAWAEGTGATLSTTEFGPVDAALADGTPYVMFVLQSPFWETDPAETPDGEYVALQLPGEDTRLDFFFAPGGYVRLVRGEDEKLFQAMWTDENVSCADAMQGWYYAAAEQAGLKEADHALDAFRGTWAEKIAGRGTITFLDAVAPGVVKIEASWPESAGVMDTWHLTARLEDGKLVYENGQRIVTEFDEKGEGWTVEESWDESGWFAFNEAGELCWHDNNNDSGEDSLFIR